MLDTQKCYMHKHAILTNVLYSQTCYIRKYARGSHVIMLHIIKINYYIINTLNTQIK